LWRRGNNSPLATLGCDDQFLLGRNKKRVFGEENKRKRRNFRVRRRERKRREELFVSLGNYNP